MGIQKYIFFSIHNSDKHPEVPLMEIKYCTEKLLKDSGLNHITIRLCGFIQAHKMKEHIIPLRQVQPQMRRWTVNVQVMEKYYPRSSRNNSRLFQQLILADSEGTRMQATIFISDIELFHDSLHEFKRYHVSNALVRPIDPDYQVVQNNFQLIINGATLIEEDKSTKQEPI